LLAACPNRVPLLSAYAYQRSVSLLLAIQGAFHFRTNAINPWLRICPRAIASPARLNPQETS
jgi:hypothetical protein